MYFEMPRSYNMNMWIILTHHANIVIVQQLRNQSREDLRNHLRKEPTRTEFPRMNRIQNLRPYYLLQNYK